MPQSLLSVASKRLKAKKSFTLAAMTPDWHSAIASLGGDSEAQEGAPLLHNYLDDAVTLAVASK